MAGIQTNNGNYYGLHHPFSYLRIPSPQLVKMQGEREKTRAEEWDPIPQLYLLLLTYPQIKSKNREARNIDSKQGCVWF